VRQGKCVEGIFVSYFKDVLGRSCVLSDKRELLIIVIADIGFRADGGCDWRALVRRASIADRSRAQRGEIEAAWGRYFRFSVSAAFFRFTTA
jgi:hypothetical protein